jgi:hypothetical protein
MTRTTLATRVRRGVTPVGSPAATRLAVGILEVLSGVYGPGEGSRLLGLSLTRYYALEARAVQGLVQALEPRAPGASGGGLEALRREKQALERTVHRLQALLRATQRAVAITPAAGSGTRHRRGVGRGAKVVSRLRATPPASLSSGAPSAEGGS